MTKLLVDLGRACSGYQDRVFRDLPCKRVQVDEIWSFVYSKQKNVPESKEGAAGDIWTWPAICADTKLVPCWLVGSRDTDCATRFICDPSRRLANRVQITSDGHKPYLEAIEAGFGADVDYSMLVQIYGQPVDGPKRYSPPQIIGTHTFCCEG